MWSEESLIDLPLSCRKNSSKPNNKPPSVVSKGIAPPNSSCCVLLQITQRLPSLKIGLESSPRFDERAPEAPSAPEVNSGRILLLLLLLLPFPFALISPWSLCFQISSLSPALAKLNHTAIPLPKAANVNIEGFFGDVVILPTKTKPKKIQLLGSDGNTYVYLFKGMEDLHLDQRVMQFLDIVNLFLLKDKSSQGNFISVVGLVCLSKPDLLLL